MVFTVSEFRLAPPLGGKRRRVIDCKALVPSLTQKSAFHLDPVQEKKDSKSRQLRSAKDRAVGAAKHAVCVIRRLLKLSPTVLAVPPSYANDPNCYTPLRGAISEDSSRRRDDEHSRTNSGRQAQGKEIQSKEEVQRNLLHQQERRCPDKRGGNPTAASATRPPEGPVGAQGTNPARSTPARPLQHREPASGDPGISRKSAHTTLRTTFQKLKNSTTRNALDKPSRTTRRPLPVVACATAGGALSATTILLAAKVEKSRGSVGGGKIDVEIDVVCVTVITLTCVPPGSSLFSPLPSSPTSPRLGPDAEHPVLTNATLL